MKENLQAPPQNTLSLRAYHFRIFSIALFLLSCQHLVAQQIHHRIEYSGRVLQLRIWNTHEAFEEEHLLHSPMGNRIHQDTKGFLWRKAGGRVFRFDGHKYRALPFPTVTSSFHSIAVDKLGNVWQSQNGGDCPIQVFSYKSDQILSMDQYIKDSTTRWCDKFKDKRTELYNIGEMLFIYSTSSNELYRFDGKEIVLINFPPYFDKFKPSRIVPASTNRYWHIPSSFTKSDSIRSFTQEGVPHQSYFWNVNTQSLFIDHNLNLWTIENDCQSQSLKDFISPIVPDSSIKYFPNSGVLPWSLGRSIYCNNSSSNYTLVGDSQGMRVFKDGNRVIENLWPEIKKVFPKFFLSSKYITPSKQGGFWIPGNGYLVHISFEPVLFQKTFMGHSVRHISLLEDEKSLIVNSYSTPPTIIGAKKFEVSALLKTSSVNYSAYVEKNKIWMGKSSHIEQFDLSTNKYRKFTISSQLKKYVSPRNIRSTSDSTIEFTSNIGWHEYDYLNDQFSHHFLQDIKVNCLYTDKDNKRWAGTSKGMFSLQEETYYLDSLNGKPLEIQHIHEHSDKSFWLSTNQGLIHWRPYSHEYEIFDTKKGLSNNTVHFTHPDKRGYLWLSTNFGISVFNQKNGDIQNFFEQDGLAGNEQNYLAHAIGRDGEIILGGVNGITSFHPDSIPVFEKEPIAPITLDKIVMYDDKGMVIKRLLRTKNSTIALNAPPNCQQIKIQASHPYYKGSARRLQWRVKGFISQWTPIEDDHFLINRLPKGEFELELRAFLLKTPNLSPKLSILINQEVYTYEEKWFWALCLLGSVFCIGLFYRWRSARFILMAESLQKLVNQRTQEIEHQKTEIEKQKIRLEEIDLAKNTLFGNVSHELRTPLSIIYGHTEYLLSKKEITNDHKASIKHIKKHAKVLSLMVDELLSLQKVDSGTLSLQKKEEDWLHFLNNQFVMLQGLADQQEHTYTMQSTLKNNFLVEIDSQKVERILQNLITNALKYTPKKGKITIHVSQSVKDLELIIEDNGIGISAENQVRIFDRFHQISSPLTSEQPGYGIGLALSKEYATLMGAQLRVDSIPKQGSRFTFSIPLDTVNARPIPFPITLTTNNQNEPYITSVQEIQRPRDKEQILIIEDNVDLQNLIKESLHKNYRVSVVSNGQEAINLLSKGNSFRLIISDVMMPVMNGFELLKSIRNNRETGHLPFLLLTALTSMPNKIKAFRLGVDGYLTKPFSIAELNARVENLIRPRKKEHPANSQKQVDSHSPKIEGTPIAWYDHEWVEQLEAIVKKEIANPDLKIVDLAFQLHVSERTLRNRIHDYLSMKPLEYLKKARLHQALFLLQQKKHPTVGEISIACGFKDPKYFSILFKKEFGQPPSEYL